MEEEKFKNPQLRMDGIGTLLQPRFASELSITFVASLGGKKTKNWSKH